MLKKTSQEYKKARLDCWNRIQELLKEHNVTIREVMEFETGRSDFVILDTIPIFLKRLNKVKYDNKGGTYPLETFLELEVAVKRFCNRDFQKMWLELYKEFTGYRKNYDIKIESIYEAYQNYLMNADNFKETMTYHTFQNKIYNGGKLAKSGNSAPFTYQELERLIWIVKEMIFGNIQYEKARTGKGKKKDEID